MNDDQLLRYSRHILLPELGISGQEIILKSNALIIGAGGLGSPASMYLAAAGIGTITIADDDVVDLTNLQRQIVHHTGDIGKNKVTSAKETLSWLNPDVIVKPLVSRLDQNQIDNLVETADVVLDCTDNFETRHAVNKACVGSKTPLVSGAAIRFEGQISVFDSSIDNSPCYECLFSENSKLEETRCAVLGAFGPLVGMVGTIQAMETIKTLTKIGQPMRGKLLLIDGLLSEFKVLKLPRDPNCAVCSAHSTEEHA